MYCNPFSWFLITTILFEVITASFYFLRLIIIFCWYADVERSWPITMRGSSIWISSDRPLYFSHDVFSGPYPHSPLTSCALSYRHWRWSCYTFPPFFNPEWSCWRRWTFPTYERLVWRFRWMTWHRWWSRKGSFHKISQEGKCCWNLWYFNSA